jgi:uncharacterized protein (DUF433 family)
LDFLAGGVSEAEILADYPQLQPEDIRACIAYALKSRASGSFPSV